MPPHSLLLISITRFCPILIGKEQPAASDGCSIRRRICVRLTNFIEFGTSQASLVHFSRTLYRLRINGLQESPVNGTFFILADLQVAGRTRKTASTPERTEPHSTGLRPMALTTSHFGAETTSCRGAWKGWATPLWQALRCPPARAYPFSLASGEQVGVSAIQ